MSDCAPALEALLLMATEPIPAHMLAQAVDEPEPEVIQALEELAASYDQTGRGFMLRHVAGGWQFATRPEHADLIRAWVVDSMNNKLSQAALEALAVIAYQQPTSRSRVTSVRGVNSDGVIRTLIARDLVVEDGSDQTTGAGLLHTTDTFLQRLGINSVDELPPIAPLLPEAAQLEQELTALTVGTQPQTQENHD